MKPVFLSVKCSAECDLWPEGDQDWMIERLKEGGTVECCECGCGLENVSCLGRAFRVRNGVVESIWPPEDDWEECRATLDETIHNFRKWVKPHRWRCKR